MEKFYLVRAVYCADDPTIRGSTLTPNGYRKNDSSLNHNESARLFNNRADAKKAAERFSMYNLVNRGFAPVRYKIVPYWAG